MVHYFTLTEPLLKDNFFLLADDYRFQLYQADVTLTSIKAIKTPPTDRPIALDYDFREDRVYWSDFRENILKRAFLNGSDTVIIKFKENSGWTLLWVRLKVLVVLSYAYESYEYIQVLKMVPCLDSLYIMNVIF